MFFSNLDVNYQHQLLLFEVACRQAFPCPQLFRIQQQYRILSQAITAFQTSRQPFRPFYLHPCQASCQPPPFHFQISRQQPRQSTPFLGIFLQTYKAALRPPSQATTKTAYLPLLFRQDYKPTNPTFHQHPLHHQPPQQILTH